MTRVSLVIPTVNREALLCDAIRAALAQDCPALEVIVIDQSARHEPGTVSFLSSVADRIRYHSQSPPNLPAARNTGVRLATGDVVVFFDDDIAAGPGIVSAVAAHFADPDVAGATGFVASPWDVGDERYEAFRRYVSDPDTLRRPGLLPVDHFVGCFMAFRRSVFDRVGGFDEWIGTQPTAASEDVEFCMRVRQAGLRLYLDTRLTVVNVGGSRVEGGCEKGTLPRDVIVFNQMMLLLYAYLKNQRQRGPLGWYRSIAPVYRGYVFNRGILRGGARLVWQRHLRFVRALQTASQAVVEQHRRPVWP